MRREAKEANSIAQGMNMPSFNKLDLMSLVLSKHLHTKTQLLVYVQDHRSPQAQLFVSRQQRRLAEFIEDAHEWADAKAEVITNSMTEWDIFARPPIPHARTHQAHASAQRP